MADVRLQVVVVGSPVLAGQLSTSRRLRDADVEPITAFEDALARFKDGAPDAAVIHAPMLKSADVAALADALPQDRPLLVVDHSAPKNHEGRPTLVRRPDVEDALVSALHSRRGARASGAGLNKEPVSDAYAAGLAKLKQKFKAALPGRLDLVETSLNAAEADPSDENLDAAITAAHKLAGAAGMFEMKEVGSAALAIEKTIEKTRAESVDFETAKARLDALKAAIADVLDAPTT